MPGDGGWDGFNIVNGNKLLVYQICVLNSREWERKKPCKSNIAVLNPYPANVENMVIF